MRVCRSGSIRFAIPNRDSIPNRLSNAIAAWPSGSRDEKSPYQSGVAEGLIRHKVDPVYPWDAKVNHITGDVLLKAVIDRQGNIANLELLRGDPILAESAIKAVKQWKYRPYILNGEAIEAETTVKIQYHM